MSHVSRALAGAIVVNEIVATACQFIQQTDSRFALLYFTVASAVLASITSAMACISPGLAWLAPMRIASATGVLLSAIVFATVIAPATPAGGWFQPWDDRWVRTATVLMHGTAPVLVAVDVAIRPRWRPLTSWVLAGLSWPLTYLAAMGVLSMTGAATMPYPFLQPSRAGWPAVGGAIAILALLVVALSATLFVVNRVIARVGRSPAA